MKKVVLVAILSPFGFGITAREYVDAKFAGFKALTEGVDFTDTRTDDEKKRAANIERAHA